MPKSRSSGDEVSLQTSRSSPKTGKSPNTSKKKKKNSSSESSPLTSQSSVASTTFVESEGKSSTSLGDDVSQFPITDHKEEPKYGPKVREAKTWGGLRNAEKSLSSSLGSSLLGSGFQRPQRRVASNSKEDQAKRQTYRPSPQNKALLDELEQVKKERDDAKQELANERDRIEKIEEDHRKDVKEIQCLKEKNENLACKVSELQSKLNVSPLKSSDPSLPECDEGVNHRSLPESNTGGASGDVGQQYRSYQSFGAVNTSLPDSSKVDTWRRELHLEEELKKRDEEISQLKQKLQMESQDQDLEQRTCSLAKPLESDELENLRKRVKTMESAAQQKEETIAQLTKECTELKKKLQQQETDHNLQALNVQEDLTQALKTNEALNLEMQQLSTSQSEQIELRVKKENEIFKSKEWKLSTSTLVEGESDVRSVDELMAEKQGQIDSLELQLKEEKGALEAKIRKLNEKQEEIDALKKEKESLEAENKDFLEQLKESVSEKKLVRMRQELTGKQQEIQKLQEQSVQSKTALEETERRSEQFKQEVNALKVALKDTKEERDALKEAKATVCTKLEEQSVQSRTALEESERRSSQLQQELNDVQEEFKKAEQELNVARDELKSGNAILRRKMEREKEVLMEKAQSESSKFKQKLQEEMEEKEKTVISLQKQLKDLQVKYTAQMSTLEEKLFKQHKEKEAEANDKDLDEQMAKMHRQIEDLWKQIESLQAEKRTLKSEKQNLLVSLSKQRDSEKRQAEQLEFLKGKLREKDDTEAEGKRVIDDICKANDKKEKEMQSLQDQLTRYRSHIAILEKSASGEKTKLRKELNAAKEELDAAKVEIDARIQHEVKITRELRTTTEEKNRLHDQLQAVQFQMEAYKTDFELERNDRATAAGRYNEEEEQLKKTLQDLNEKLEKKVLEIDELQEKLEREQFERAAEAANHSDQVNAFQRTICQIRIARDETEARLLQLRDVSVTNKNEAENYKMKFEHAQQRVQQLTGEIEQLQKDNAKLTRDIAAKSESWVRKSDRRLSQSDYHGRHGGYRGDYQGDHHGGCHGKEGEDSQLTMVELQSEKTFWEEQCKRQEKDFEDRKGQFQQLEKQLRGEIHQLKQDNAHLGRGTQAGVNLEAHGCYEDQHGVVVEDVDMMVATLKSKNSHLEEQNRQQKKDYEYQHQVLSQQYHDSQRTVEKLREEIRELHDRLKQPAVSPRGPVDPHYPEHDIKVPPGYTNRGDITERDNHYPPDRRQQGQPPHLNPGSDSGYSDARSPVGRSPYMSPQVDRKHSREGRIDEFVTNDAHFDNTPNYDGRIKDMPIDNTSHDDTSTFDLELSAGLPAPLHRSVQMSLSSDSDTSFQPNRRYIGDGINREIKQQAKHYKQGVQRGLPVADEVDEELWPYDPNLVCPHCGKRFRHGQIREFRYHIDDEHSPSMV